MATRIPTRIPTSTLPRVSPRTSLPAGGSSLILNTMQSYRDQTRAAARTGLREVRDQIRDVKQQLASPNLGKNDRAELREQLQDLRQSAARLSLLARFGQGPTVVDTFGK